MCFDHYLKRVYNVTYVVYLLCFVCEEEDFLDATDESSERNNKQGQDLITAPNEHISTLIVHSGEKRLYIFLAV